MTTGSSTRRRTIVVSRLQPNWRYSRNQVSEEPGAVQTALCGLYEQPIVADQPEQLPVAIEAELTEHRLVGDRAVLIDLVHHVLDETQIRSHLDAAALDCVDPASPYSSYHTFP